ncbi:hypothetical protein ASG24_01475 [Methylophilus sp. Leaf414]|nr:hypothetical protein ASG24_01475 [Methylophilus sp. Leaf414]
MAADLPGRYYRQDPATIVENDQLHKLGCRGCDHAVSALNRWYCSNDKAEKNHKRVPHIGPSCKFYKLKG